VLANRQTPIDIIFIHDLKIEAYIGAYAWEQQVKQTLVFDLDLGFCIQKAAMSDAINDALDYAVLSQHLHEYLSDKKFALIETMAEKVAEFLLKTFALPWLKIKITKLGTITRAKAVGVIIERSATP